MTTWPSQYAHSTVWQPIAAHEPIQTVAVGGNFARGFLIALGISAVLWAALGTGIWFVLGMSV